MFQDEKTFPNPQEFIPERFIRDGKLTFDSFDPEVIATFGFGRRYYSPPHRHLAQV